MKILKGVFATTHRDSHNEALAPEGIEMLVEHMNSRCIPIWIQHDPRIPPAGRCIRAEVQTLPDGELAVVGEAEIWEAGDAVPFLPNRRMPLGEPDDDRPFVSFDRSLSDEATLQDLREIERLIGCHARSELKKAVDPLTVLTIGGTFVGCAIANGFLKQLGADAYKTLKEKLKGVFRRRREAAMYIDNPPENLFIFKAFVQDEKGKCSVETIITNPSDEDIERFFPSGLQKLDSILPALLRVLAPVRSPAKLNGQKVCQG